MFTSCHFPNAAHLNLKNIEHFRIASLKLNRLMFIDLKEVSFVGEGELQTSNKGPSEKEIHINNEHYEQPAEREESVDGDGENLAFSL